MRYLGVSPTPTTLRAAQNYGAAAAISMSASHNSAEYGGWKGTVGPDKLSGVEPQKISNRAWQIMDTKSPLHAVSKMGARLRPRYRHDYIDAYVTDVAEAIESSFGAQPLMDKAFVIDAAQGAAQQVTPQVFRRLGATVHEFACDGETPINDGCGATDLSGAQRYAYTQDLHKDPNFVGIIANDGDADRIIGAFPSIDTSGNIHPATVDGNRLLEYMSENERGVVGTVYTNDASVERIRERDVDFAFCGNGDVAVTQKLYEHGWRIGSEFSGHHVDLAWLSSGDGILKGAWLAAYAVKNGMNFADLVNSTPLYPEVMRKLQLPQGTRSIDIGKLSLGTVLDSSPADQAQSFRHVTRASGTEPVVRIWGVGKSQEYVNKRTKLIEQAISQSLHLGTPKR